MMNSTLFDPELAMLPILTATWEREPVDAVISYQNTILQTEIGSWSGRPLIELLGAVANSDGRSEIAQLVAEGSLVLYGTLNHLEVKYHSRVGEQHIQMAISDNTEINQLRDKVQRDEVVNSFLSVSSHELKTPLTVLQGMISMLEEDLVDEGQRQLLEMAHENAIKLDGIVNRILSTFYDGDLSEEAHSEEHGVDISQYIRQLYRSELSPYLSTLSFPEKNLRLYAQSEVNASEEVLHKIF
ncbi:MAG: hypothetical protein HN344_08830, partial [Gammaproteobacteria bacterium]|nr:hypothetical protein [Gammaproteobacteria bacterium]